MSELNPYQSPASVQSTAAVFLPEDSEALQRVRKGLQSVYFGIVAILLALISAVCREHWRVPVYAAGLGSAAVLFQFFWLLAVLIAGVILLVAIIENIGDIFGGGWLWGWFGD